MICSSTYQYVRFVFFPFSDCLKMYGGTVKTGENEFGVLQNESLHLVLCCNKITSFY